VEDADLTKIKGIGEATEKLIKDHFGWIIHW
jgi:predicted flap endonuclease-1-like 5' DNA nuclease